MSNTAIIFGGAGYIGTRLAVHLRERGWEHVLLADIKPSVGVFPPGIDSVHCDVRKPIEDQIGARQSDWIFNFAAIHREPGHRYREYFDTNLPGARNVCAYAERVGCENIFFTSSIAVYGEISRPTDECTATYPDTAYGISKLCAELTHERWQAAARGRRLVVVRPGVVYGPGEPGNMLRMIQAMQKGRFVFPGDGSVRKSYAYIFGLLESMEFMLARTEPCLRYNYVERETEPLRALVEHVAALLSLTPPRLRAPIALLMTAARIAQLATNGSSPLHPLRVRKAAQSTHIVPAELIRLGFDFRYDFPTSLRHWITVAPGDFGPSSGRRARAAAAACGPSGLDG
ncbi:MAG: NAD(P)-dependent oxidoreductase [Proteobacteria bacterium]|nr:NAD(P)-dependent oxidoreductase [Pseudomonadota bacterium]